MKLKKASLPIFEKYLLPVLTIVVIWAIVLRILLYYNGADFILDEVNLARNLQERNFTALAHPLSYQQHAPFLFLCLSKTMALLFGYSEQILRLVPLLSGVLAIIVFAALLIKRKYSFLICLVGVVLFAFNVVVLRYGLTFKQYSVDLLVALIIIFIHPLYNKRLSQTVIVLIGIIVIFLSMPSIFVLVWFAISSYFLTIDKNYLGMGLLWLLIFSINYFLFLQPSVSSDHLQTYHANYFLSIPVNAQSLNEITGQMVMIFTGVFGKTTVALIIGMGMFLWGLIKNRQNLLLFIPIALLLIAAMMQKYSLIDRLILFVYPFIILLFLDGLQHIYETIIRLATKIKYIPLFLLFLLSIIILSASSRYKYWPGKGIYGMEGVSEEFRKWMSTNDSGCQILTHNAAPFYHYYRNTGKVPDVELPVLSWDHHEIHDFKKGCDTLTIIDVHTFGEEKSMLSTITSQYNHRSGYISTDMEIIQIN